LCTPAFNRRAEAHDYTGDYDKVIADYEELLRLDPNYAGAENCLARAYGSRGGMYYEKNITRVLFLIMRCL
jgi:tetratricopeptide (TPR) repeat protein